MVEPVSGFAAARSFASAVRFFRGTLPDRSRSYEEILADVLANPIPATRADVQRRGLLDAKDLQGRRVRATGFPSSAPSAGVRPPSPAISGTTPAAEPIRPSPPAGEVGVVPPVEVITDFPTQVGILRPAAQAAIEAAKAAAREIARRARRTPGEKGTEEARRATEAARRAIEEAQRRAARGADRGKIQRPKDPRSTSRDPVFSEKQWRKLERGSRSISKTGQSIPPSVLDIEKFGDFGQLPRTQPIPKTAQGEIIVRPSPKVPATGPRGFPIAALAAGLGVVSLPLLVKSARKKGGTRRPPRRVTPSRARKPDIGFRPRGGSFPSPPPVSPPAPTPPITDPLTPTTPIPGVTTQTSSPLFSRQRQRTKECQEVLRRRRRKGQCKEGFFEELPGRTRFTTWRTYDCKSGKTVKRK